MRGSDFGVQREEFQGVAFKKQGFGCSVWVVQLVISGFRVQGLGCRAWGLGVRVWGAGFGVWGFGFGVWGAGCMVHGAGCGIWRWRTPTGASHPEPLSYTYMIQTQNLKPLALRGGKSPGYEVMSNLGGCRAWGVGSGIRGLGFGIWGQAHRACADAGVGLRVDAGGWRIWRLGLRHWA